MKNFSITNGTGQAIEIIIEPIAESYQLLQEQKVIIESTLNETLEIDFNGKELIVWEEFGPKREMGETLKVYVEGLLVYPNWL